MARTRRRILAVLALSACAGTIAGAPAGAGDPAAGPPPPASTEPPSKLWSGEDGWLDLSRFLDEPYGFVPLLIPITEPAVGFGAAGALVFIGKPGGEGPGGLSRANITALGGLATRNGTTGLMAGDLRHFMDNRVQTMVGFVSTSINLDFHGVGEDSALSEDPLGYTIEPVGGLVRGKYRFGDSQVWGGLGYVLASTGFRFDDEAGIEGAGEIEGESRVGGLVPSFTYDSRDNIFTPGRGTYVEATAGFFGPALGGDDSFRRIGLTLIHHRPVQPRLIVGMRGGSTLSFGDVPFYLLPFINLRGAPVMRYQGEQAAEVEVEVRWQFWKRFSVVGFAGGGAAWNDFTHLDNTVTVLTGGTGFRYELAREYGLHAGLDVAFGPDDTALYVQLGSAWARP